MSNETNALKQREEEKEEEPKTINETKALTQKEEESEEEPKTYIGFYCCKLSLNIIYALSYVSAAVFLNVINRVIFYTYHFNKYNFTFMLLQQLFCIVFFLTLSQKSETFKSKAGEISINNFLTLKYYYFSFGIVFILNALVTIIGTQMIVNAAMFQTLRKLTLVKVYIFDLFFGYKKISTFVSICVILVTVGGLLSGIDTFSRDYIGITVTMVGNMITVAYNKLTESFRRRTGVPNIKLLVYNCYLAGPVLFLLIFITGEYKRLILYFKEEGYKNGENNTENSFYGFFFSLFFSCSLVIALNCGFFMSNEKNSSLFTILLANTKDIFTSILSYFMLSGNKFTVNIALGLIISTAGAVMFSLKSIWDNMITGFTKHKQNEHDAEAENNSNQIQVVTTPNENNEAHENNETNENSETTENNDK